MNTLESAGLFIGAAAAFAAVAARRGRDCARPINFFAVPAIALGAAGCCTSLKFGRFHDAPTALFAAAYIVVCAITDMQVGLVFDVVTVACAAAVITSAAMLGSLPAAFAGCFVTGGVMIGLHLVTRGRGIGLGDVKAAAVIGASFGAAYGIAVLGAAFVLGTLVVLPAVALGRIARGDAVPFAPYLASATLVVVPLLEIHR